MLAKPEVARVEAVLARRDHPQHERCDDRGNDLGDDVGGRVLPGEPPPETQADGDGRVEVPAGDVSDGVGHGEHAQAEREGDPEVADADVGDAGRDDRRAAAGEDQPERAEELSAKAPGQCRDCRGGRHLGRPVYVGAGFRPRDLESVPRPDGDQERLGTGHLLDSDGQRRSCRLAQASGPLRP